MREDQTTETVELAGADRERESEPELPPIDEDVTGQVNAAVPPGEDES